MDMNIQIINYENNLPILINMIVLQEFGPEDYKAPNGEIYPMIVYKVANGKIYREKFDTKSERDNRFNELLSDYHI